MLLLAFHPPSSITPLIHQILVSRRLTLTERRQLQSVLLRHSLNETDHLLLDRVLYGVRHGLLLVKD